MTWQALLKLATASFTFETLSSRKKCQAMMWRASFTWPYVKGGTGGASTSPAQGGLIYSRTRLTITNSNLSGGTAGEGGGVFITGRGLHLFRFQLNLSASVHRVTQLNPECVLELLKLSSNVNKCKPLITGIKSSPSYFTDSTITDCNATAPSGVRAGNNGGCFYVGENDEASAIVADSGLGMVFSNPSISGCRAHAGGGVFLTRGRLAVTGGQISQNAANYEGGGMTVAAAVMTMTAGT